MFNRKANERLREIEHKLDILDLHLTIRDPGTARSAEAYDGLRKLLINANKQTQVHLAHLAEIDRLSRTSDDLQIVRIKIEELMNQVGLARWESAEIPEAFEIHGTPGTEVIIDMPAYLDAQSGTVVIRGSAHYSEPSDASEANPSEVNMAFPTVEPETARSETVPLQEGDAQ